MLRIDALEQQVAELTLQVEDALRRLDATTCVPAGRDVRSTSTEVA